MARAQIGVREGGALSGRARAPSCQRLLDTAVAGRPRASVGRASVSYDRQRTSHLSKRSYAWAAAHMISPTTKEVAKIQKMAYTTSHRRKETLRQRHIDNTARRGRGPAGRLSRGRAGSAAPAPRIRTAIL